MAQLGTPGPIDYASGFKGIESPIDAYTRTKRTLAQTEGLKAGTRAQELATKEKEGDIAAREDYLQVQGMMARKQAYETQVKDPAQAEAARDVRESMSPELKGILRDKVKNIGPDGSIIVDEDMKDLMDPVKLKTMADAGTAIVNAPKGESRESWYNHQTTLLKQREQEIVERGGDPRHTRNMIAAETPEERDLMGKMVIQAAQIRGVIPKAPPAPPGQWVERTADGKQIYLPNSTIMASQPGTYIKQDRTPFATTEAGVTKAQELKEAAEIRKEERQIAKEGRTETREVSIAEKKDRLKSNEKRITNLGSTAAGRKDSIKNAQQFLSAFKKGAESGAGRTAMGYVPGVWTDQGQFDEEFNAFAEVAARVKLKSSGETRPTDADVEGMKKAMFGVGRDEQTNMNLLEDYIREQKANTQEYNKLKNAKKKGKLSSYSPEPEYVPVPEVKRKLADGRTAIFNEDTKKFIRYE